MADWRYGDRASGVGFAQAEGNIAFQTDGTMVNTWEGRRELRLGLFAKRPCGWLATAEQWDNRRLPASGARVLFGGSRRRRTSGRAAELAARLGIRDAAAVSVLADWAEWI